MDIRRFRAGLRLLAASPGVAPDLAESEKTKRERRIANERQAKRRARRKARRRGKR